MKIYDLWNTTFTFTKVQYGTTCTIRLSVLFAFRIKAHFEIEKI